MKQTKVSYRARFRSSSRLLKIDFEIGSGRSQVEGHFPRPHHQASQRYGICRQPREGG